MKVGTSIKKEDFGLWYEIFKCSGGRLTRKPMEFSKSVMVEYIFDDIEQAEQFHHSFKTLTMPIVETRRSWWAKFKRKIVRLVKG
jgi:hypothetical protein